MAKFIKFPPAPWTVRNDIKKKNKDGTVARQDPNDKESPAVIAIAKGSPSELPGADTVDGQMLRYLQDKYGDTPAEQYAVMLELNAHQSDDSVIKSEAERVRPLSQIFAFKVADWYAKGFVERATAKEIEKPAKPGKVQALEARVTYLEGLLAEQGIQFDKAA